MFFPYLCSVIVRRLMAAKTKAPEAHGPPPIRMNNGVK